MASPLPLVEGNHPLRTEPKHLARPRCRRRSGWAAALLVAVVGLIAAAGCTRNAESFRVYQLANAEREAAGERPLDLDGTLVAKAQAWAETLAATGTLRHSNLTDGAPGGWVMLAENVARGSSPEEAHALLMASAGHRANILDGRYNRVGVGAAWSGGRLYVVQVFALLS